MTRAAEPDPLTSSTPPGLILALHANPTRLGCKTNPRKGTAWGCPEAWHSFRHGPGPFEHHSEPWKLCSVIARGNRAPSSRDRRRTPEMYDACRPLSIWVRSSGLTLETTVSGWNRTRASPRTRHVGPAVSLSEARRNPEGASLFSGRNNGLMIFKHRKHL